VNANGTFAPGWDAFDVGLNANLTPYIAAGKNRIVLTHVDDNPHERALRNVRVSLNGSGLSTCP
jgi:hypothetical protein